MNTQDQDLVTETQTPLEEIKQVDRQHFNMPIMIEITEEDRQSADRYTNPSNCIAMKALLRNGFCPTVGMGTGKIKINGHDYYSNDLNAVGVCSQPSDKPYYSREVVGKQFIFYPENT